MGKIRMAAEAYGSGQDNLDQTRRSVGLSLLGALTWCASAGGAAQAQAQKLPGLIETRESQYNTIYILRDGDYVTMLFGVNQRLFTESRYNPKRPRELPVDYTRYMTAALAYTPQARTLLEIGLGGGTIVQYLNLHMPELAITCVEIDPEVIALAKKYFGLTPGPKLQVVAADGRLHLTRNQVTYDLILVDAYRGTWVPEHLLSREFFALAKSRLNPGGVMAQNVEPTTMLYDAAIATIKAVFAHVDVFESGGNVVAVAYDGPTRDHATLLSAAQGLQTRFKFTHGLPEMMARRRIVSRATGRVLTDDFNPAEQLRAIARGNDRTGR
jgi:spermidine synthase